MKKRSRELASPDITPLIDVVFLLLIFFMTSTVFKKDELALMLNLPKTVSGEGKSKNESIIIELNKDTLAINKKILKINELGSYIKSIENKKVPVELRVDKKVEYERVIGVLDVLKANQLTNLSLITDR